MKNNEQSPIVIGDLHKSFGEQKVLNGIDLVVHGGETLAVLGRSGTGKSVLLKLIVGLQKPDSGSIRVLGQDIARLDGDQLNEIRKKIGFLFQSAALYDSLTIEENVAFPLARHTRMSEAERKSRARELLSAVGMESGLEKLPSEISGGMQKRVGLARALALDPEILLFDEPMAGLDPITAAEIGKLIVEEQKKRNITSVVVTHEIHSAKIFADRFVLMNEGKILADGALDDLRESRNEFVAEFLREAA
ncbi:MAG TPA: ATP-binding cassette domain-containing protein [Bryobacteraceae bacterium]|nr:ATP-binding cassette domain-containing protein [Bryobacteraceae bacterium]